MTRILAFNPLAPSPKPIHRRFFKPRPLLVRVREDQDENEIVQEDAEERIARLEATARRRPTATEQTARDTADDLPPSNMREWKEGELLPDGWEELNTKDKAWELYAGERGALYWANRIALAASIAMGVAWVFFRFVGPQFGLYELKSTLGG